MAAILWRPVRSISNSTQTFNKVAHSSGAINFHAAKKTSAILPPFKKSRDELSVLKALSSTVKQDPTGYSYRWLDDPLMISRYQLRQYLNSKAAGINAARYVLHQMPNTVAGFRSEEPKIHRFSPIRSPDSFIKEYEESKATAEQTLNSLIMLCASQEAWKFYSDLEKESFILAEELPQSLIQSLLELLAATNGKNIELEKHPNITFISEPPAKSKPISVWNRDGPAEILFRALPKTSKSSYCAMIRGCGKYFDLQRVLELESELRAANLTPDLATYNSILRCLFQLEDESGPYLKIDEILNNMKREGIKPNLETFTNIAFTLRYSGFFLIEYSKTMLEEFHKLDLQPSLGLYANLLYRAPLDFVQNLFDRLNKNDFLSEEVHSPDDFSFFHIAMSMAMNCNNPILAHKINRYLLKTNRQKFLGLNNDSNGYYIKYLRLQYQNDDLNAVLKNIWLYPHACSFRDITFIVSRIRKEGNYHLLANIWEFTIAHGRALGDFSIEGPLSMILNIVRSTGSDGVNFLPSLELLESRLGMEVLEASLVTACYKDSLHSNCIKYCLEVGNVDAAMRWCKLCSFRNLTIPILNLISLCEVCESLERIGDAFLILRLIKDRIQELNDVVIIRALVKKLQNRQELTDLQKELLSDVTKYVELRSTEKEH